MQLCHPKARAVGWVRRSLELLPVAGTRRRGMVLAPELSPPHPAEASFDRVFWESDETRPSTTDDRGFAAPVATH